MGKNNKLIYYVLMYVHNFEWFSHTNWHNYHCTYCLGWKTFEIHPFSYFGIYWYSLLTIVTSSLQQNPKLTPSYITETLCPLARNSLRLDSSLWKLYSLSSWKILWCLPLHTYLILFSTVFFEFIVTDTKDNSVILKTKEYIVSTCPSSFIHSHVIETCIDYKSCLL